MKKEAKVHMLPTEKGTIATYKKTGNLAKPNFRIGIFESDAYQPQHLYITTDEEIKEGDLCYDEEASPGWNGIKGISKCLRTDKDGYWNKRCRKIIATTDPKLLLTCKECGNQKMSIIPKYNVLECDDCGYPSTSNNMFKIPQSFIKEYCKAGSIDKVLVEYLEDGDLIELGEYTPSKGFSHDHYGNKIFTKDPVYHTGNPVLKRDSNNCIIIHPVEEKMYSRKEIENMMMQSYIYGQSDKTDNFHKRESTIKKLIKENL